MGGALGIGGAVIAEIGSVGFLLLIFIGAPIIEEIFKPIGVYLGQVWFPQALRNRVYVALLCALGGVVFGLIESWVYVNVYVDDPSDAYVQFRYTVPVALHAAASVASPPNTPGIPSSSRLAGDADGSSELTTYF